MSRNVEQLKEFLVGTPFFGGLEDAPLDRLTRLLTAKTFRKGDVVFKAGDKGRSMYIIETGEILMCRAGVNGHRLRLVRLNEGDFFGETTLIEMQPRPFDAVVERDGTTLLELTNMDLYKLYREDVHGYVMVLQNINRELCRRLRKSDMRLTDMADDMGDEATQIKPIRR